MPLSTVTDITQGIARGDINTRGIADSAVKAAEKLNESLNAFLQIDRDFSLRRAAGVDQNSDKASLVLAGVPIAIKDNICVKGLQTSCGSHILGSYQPPYNATAIERLNQAGAVIIGKTNCDEFAMGSSNENSAFVVVKNPWDTSRVPGCSSGGSAAAVAAGIVPVALGSDTGGSVRQPAALSGVIGFKPTYGRVSRYGLVAFGSSLDQIGVFARNAKDAAAVLQVIAGRDVHDATTADGAVPNYVDDAETDMKSGFRIGVSRALLGEGLDDEVRQSIEDAIEAYRELGAQIVDIDLPHAKYAIAVYYIIATAEASSTLARYDGVRYGFRAEDAPALRDMYKRTRDEGFGPEVKRRIMLGTYVLSAGYYDAYYLQAQKVRQLITRDFERAFTEVDVLMGPTTPTPAFGLGAKTSDPITMYLNDIYTIGANLAGLPAMSIPCGFVGKLPVGLQIVGPHFGEEKILSAAHAFQKETDWH